MLYKKIVLLTILFFFSSPAFASLSTLRKTSSCNDDVKQILHELKNKLKTEIGRQIISTFAAKIQADIAPKINAAQKENLTNETEMVQKIKLMLENYLSQELIKLSQPQKMRSVTAEQISELTLSLALQLYKRAQEMAQAYSDR